MSRRKIKRTMGKPVPAHAGTEAVRGGRAAILAFLKHHHGGEVADVATHLRISYEGARSHLKQIEIEGLVEKRLLRPARAVAGRPLARYLLTPSGDHLFPKSYDQLAVELIDTVADRRGQLALKQVLGALTDKHVHEWAPRLEGKPLAECVAALRAVYRDGDPFMSVEIGRAGIRLIERNCPFLNVASRRPALCSVTVSTLQRLLGVKVVREERFQSGHGRCVFRVLTDEPVDTRRFRFVLEGETS